MLKTIFGKSFKKTEIAKQAPTLLRKGKSKKPIKTLKQLDEKEVFPLISRYEK